MLQFFWNSLAEIGVREAVDIALVAASLYAIIVWLKRARAGLAFLGALIVGAVYLAAREFRLMLTAWIFQGFFAAFVLILIILLRHDLRRLFERIALWGLRRKRGAASADSTIDILCNAVHELATQRRGALIVLPGKEPVDGWVEGGETLDGQVSHYLMVSLFDPGSGGHDGAAIVDGDRITRFAVHLPLSSNFEEIARRGTRHTAALGLSELTDALCIVVSEERGQTSLAQNGKLRTVEPGAEPLREEIIRFLEGTRQGSASAWGKAAVVGRDWAALGGSLGLSLALWLVFVSGTQVSQQTIKVPVLVENITPEYALVEAVPKEVNVSFTGLRRNFYSLDPTELEVRVDARMVGSGKRVFDLAENDVRHPESLVVLQIEPETVELKVTPKGEPASKTGANRGSDGRERNRAAAVLE